MSKDHSMDYLKRFFTALLLGANLCTLSFLWICCLVSNISPEYIPKLSLLGLTFPAVLLFNLLFVVLWFLFRPKFLLVPLLGLLTVGGYILDYCPINFDARVHPECIKVISFNAAGLVGEENKAKFIQYLKSEAPDIICLQELGTGWFHHKEVRQVTDSMQYSFKGGKNKCILSRMPFLSDTLHITYPTRTNGSIACWIEVHGDSVLVVNNHLESNHLSNEDKDEYTDMLKEPNNKEKFKTSGLQLLRKLANASKYRGPQTDSVCSFIKKKGMPSVIMCGDHNDTPISYTYQKTARNLNSAFRESGNGIGVSYNQKGFFFRIDHVFISEDWESCKTYIDTQMEMSDHYPLVTYLRKKQH